MVDGKPEGRGTTVPDVTRTTELVKAAAPKGSDVGKRPDEEGPTTPLDATRLLAEAAAHAESLEADDPPQRELPSVTMRIDPPAALVRATMPPEGPRQPIDAKATNATAIDAKADDRTAPTTPGSRVAPNVGARRPPTQGRITSHRGGSKDATARPGHRPPSLERMESTVASAVMIGTQLALVGALIGVTVVAFRTKLPSSTSATSIVEEQPAASPLPAESIAPPPTTPAPEPVELPSAPATDPPEKAQLAKPDPAPATPPAVTGQMSMRMSKDRSGRTPVRGSTVAAAAAMASTTIVAIAPARPPSAPPPPQPTAPPPPPAAPAPPAALTADSQTQRLTQEADQELNSANKAHTKTGR